MARVETRNDKGGQIAVINQALQPFQQRFESQKFRDAMKIAIPKHLGERGADKIIKIGLAAIGRDNKLMQCTVESVMNSMLRAAELGFEPNGALGHAYLVPMGSTCQLMISYRGMIDLARRSSEIKSVEIRAVYEGDLFDYEYGLEPRLVHKPQLDEEQGGLLYVYAVAKLNNGGHQFDVMSVKQVERIRAGSASKNSDPWTKHFDEMAKKTVLRRLFKTLPVSIELKHAFDTDDALEAPLNLGSLNDFSPNPEEPATTRTDEVKKKLADEITDAKIEEPAAQT